MIDSFNLQEQGDYWYPRVYGYFYKHVNDKTEVEDLTANTLNTVFMAKNVRNIQAYMWKVAHNYLVRFIKTKTTPIMVSLDENIDTWRPVESEQLVEENVSNRYGTKLTQLKECIKNHILNPIDTKLIELSIYQEKKVPKLEKFLKLRQMQFDKNFHDF